MHLGQFDQLSCVDPPPAIKYIKLAHQHLQQHHNHHHHHHQQQHHHHHNLQLACACVCKMHGAVGVLSWQEHGLGPCRGEPPACVCVRVQDARRCRGAKLAGAWLGAVQGEHAGTLRRNAKKHCSLLRPRAWHMHCFHYRCHQHIPLPIDITRHHFVTVRSL